MTRISPFKIRQIKRLAAVGVATKDIARQIGLSPSSVHKARCGAYDGRMEEANAGFAEEEDDDVVWCPRCRCHVYWPCRICQLREHQRGPRTTRRPAPLPAGLSDPEIVRRLRRDVAEIGLQLRVVNQLHQWGILTVNDLLHCSRDELLGLPGFAEKTLQHIFDCLERLGFARRAR